MEILISLGFVMHPSKSEFIPSKTIECLGFVMNTEDMTIKLTYAKKMVICNMCTHHYAVLIHAHQLEMLESY